MSSNQSGHVIKVYDSHRKFPFIEKTSVITDIRHLQCIGCHLIISQKAVATRVYCEKSFQDLAEKLQ